jgi:hypothetical protein
VAGAAATLFGLRGRWRGGVGRRSEAARKDLESFEIDWDDDCSRETVGGFTSLEHSLARVGGLGRSS